MIAKVYEIICDSCYTLLMHAYTVEECKQLMKENGWVTRKKLHYCGYCKEDLK